MGTFGLWFFIVIFITWKEAPIGSNICRQRIKYEQKKQLLGSIAKRKLTAFLVISLFYFLCQSYVFSVYGNIYIYIYIYVVFSDGPYGNLTHIKEFSLICHFFFFLPTSLITNIVHVSGIWVGVCFLNFFLFLEWIFMWRSLYFSITLEMIFFKAAVVCSLFELTLWLMESLVWALIYDTNTRLK